MFEPGGKKKDKREFIESQKAMLDEMAWIVEGCLFSTFEMRFAKSDVLIYFHFSRVVCFWRLLKGYLTTGKTSEAYGLSPGKS
jgi:adenylate kinase family enzyme